MNEGQLEIGTAAGEGTRPASGGGHGGSPAATAAPRLGDGRLRSPVCLHAIVEVQGADAIDVSGVAGLDGSSPVSVVRCGGIAALAGEYAGQDLAALPKRDLLDRLLAHQRVVERVLPCRAVLPVKFGTLLPNLDEVQALLVHGHRELADALAGARGMVEMEVAVVWDLARALEEIGHDEDIARAREALAMTGSPSIAQRVELGRKVKASLDARSQAHRDRITARLAAQASDVVNHALMSDAMVLNAAFLMERSRGDGFAAEVARLRADLGGLLTCRVVGPLPLYSFRSLQVERLTGDDLGEARRLLGVGRNASEGDVRRAYRRVAAAETLAPPWDGQAAHRLAAARRAEALLRWHVAGRNRADDGPTHSPPAATGALHRLTIARVSDDEVAPRRYGAGT